MTGEPVLENLEYIETTEENHKIEQLLIYYCGVSFSTIVSPCRAVLHLLH